MDQQVRKGDSRLSHIVDMDDRHIGEAAVQLSPPEQAPMARAASRSRTPAVATAAATAT